jgi:hypothetical protein
VRGGVRDFIKKVEGAPPSEVCGGLVILGSGVTIEPVIGIICIGHYLRV